MDLFTLSVLPVQIVVTGIWFHHSHKKEITADPGTRALFYTTAKENIGTGLKYFSMFMKKPQFTASTTTANPPLEQPQQ
jgi:hypothetical protein